MVACTVVTIASIEIYRALFHSMSVVGLAIASDIGIVANTIVAAVLLHRRRLVSLADFAWLELWKSILVAAVAGTIAWRVGRLMPLEGSRAADLYSLGLSTITWAAVVAAGLWILRSDLPRTMRRGKAPVEKPMAQAARMEP
jgi:putative peptidoglycan lipid II flippase